MCIFKQDDVDDMADKLRMLLDMTLEERKNVGKQMRLCVETNHSLRALVVALEKVFDRI